MAQFLQHPTDCTLSCMTFPGMFFRGITRETKHAQMGADSPRSSCYPQGNCCGICGRTFGKPTLNYSQFVFPATPELNLVSEVYRASVIFETLNPNVRTFTEPFPPRHSPQLITGQIIDRFGENIQTFQEQVKWDSESSCLNILLQRSHTLFAVTNTKFISWGKYSILELF